MINNQSELKIGDELLDNFFIIDIKGGKGKSGFGQVYILWNKESNSLLALKSLQEDKNYIDVKNFKDEAINWIKLSKHPFIVNAFTVEKINNKHYLVMEPIIPDEYGRISLSDYLKDPLIEFDVLRWSIQICYAMEHINKNGFIHGDIKPDNILINFNSVKVTDFGLSMNLKENQKSYFGSREYMAPEVWEGNKTIRSDIYSFGMVLYQMLNNGKIPFDGITDEDWIEFHKNEIPSLNINWFYIVKRCLESDISKRYNSFEDVNRELKKIFKKKFNQEINEFSPEYEYLRNNIEKINSKMLLGRSYAIIGDIKNFKNTFEEIINDNEKDDIILFEYILLLIQIGDYDTALRYLKIIEQSKIISLDRIYFNIGKCFHEQNEFFNAIKYYRKSIKENDKNLMSHTNLANIYKKYGLFEWALEKYKYVLSIDESFEIALFNLSELYKNMGYSEKFETVSNKLSKISNNYDIQLNTSFLFKKEDIIKFLKFNEIPETNELYINSLFNKFIFHLENKNKEMVESLADEIFTLTDNHTFLFGIINLLIENGHNDNALKKLNYIENNLNFNPIDFLFEKTIIIKDINLNESINISKYLLKQNISNELKANVESNLGNFYLTLNKEEEAIDQFINSLKHDPYSCNIYLNLATFYAERHFFVESEYYVDKGLTLFPNNYHLLFLKGKLSLNQYNYKNAIIYFNKCLEKYPQIDTYLYIIIAYLGENKLNEAFFYLNLAFNIRDADEESALLLIALNIIKNKTINDNI